MSTIVSTCTCETIGMPADNVRLCPDHHRYWRGDKELASVTTIVKQMWPIKPDYSKAKPEVLYNALQRGIAVDELFSAYVVGTLDHIPRTYCKDEVQLFFKVRRWWDDHKHTETRSQVILADDSIAGTCDILSDDWIYELKTTYNIEVTYPIQLAAYAELHFKTFGRPPKGIRIIHLTERFPEPKIINIDMVEAAQDWLTLRTCYEMVQRRFKGKALSNGE